MSTLPTLPVTPFQTHENLTELILSHNQLTELTGFNKIVMLKKLNLYSNSITSVDNIACLTDLPRLHDIAIAGMFYRYTCCCETVDFVVNDFVDTVFRNNWQWLTEEFSFEFPVFGQLTVSNC